MKKIKKKIFRGKNKNGQLFFVHFEILAKIFFLKKSEKHDLDDYGAVFIH